MTDENKIATVVKAIDDYFADLRGRELSSDRHRDDDVVDPIFRNLLKWREHEWFTRLDDIALREVEPGSFNVTLRYSWRKNTKYRLAPGVEERPESNVGGTASIEFLIDVVGGGRKVYVDLATIVLTGDEGATEGPLIERIRNLNGRRF